jgi:hypothetical protein
MPSGAKTQLIDPVGQSITVLNFIKPLTQAFDPSYPSRTGGEPSYSYFKTINNPYSWQLL